MKNYNIPKLGLLLLIIVSLSSCSTTKTLPNGKKIDEKLVGTWVGSEDDQQIEGVRKEWEMTRNADGTFVLDFKAITVDETHEITEEGNWWVEKDTFFEYHDATEITDTYTYKVLNKNEVKFDMQSSGVDFNVPEYIFIDTRKTTSSNDAKDGLSIENAIKVNSITEEYQYVRENCDGCQFLSQALLHENGKPYDRLNVKTKEGKEIAYYFDISSFFGKF